MPGRTEGLVLTDGEIKKVDKQILHRVMGNRRKRLSIYSWKKILTVAGIKCKR